MIFPGQEFIVFTCDFLNNNSLLASFPFQLYKFIFFPYLVLALHLLQFNLINFLCQLETSSGQSESVAIFFSLLLFCIDSFKSHNGSLFTLHEVKSSVAVNAYFLQSCFLISILIMQYS